MVFQHSGAQDFDLEGGFQHSGNHPMVVHGFQHSAQSRANGNATRRCDGAMITDQTDIKIWLLLRQICLLAGRVNN